MQSRYPNDRCTRSNELICICPATALHDHCIACTLRILLSSPKATGSKCVFPLNSTANVSHVECRCTHVEDILPVNANRAARSFRQMICQSVISRDPPEIRSADAIMTNGSPLPRPALCSPGSRARWTKNSFEGLLSGEESTAWYGEAHQELV